MTELFKNYLKTMILGLLEKLVDEERMILENKHLIHVPSKGNVAVVKKGVYLTDPPITGNAEEIQLLQMYVSWYFQKFTPGIHTQVANGNFEFDFNEFRVQNLNELNDLLVQSHSLSQLKQIGSDDIAACSILKACSIALQTELVESLTIEWSGEDLEVTVHGCSSLDEFEQDAIIKRDYPSRSSEDPDLVVMDIATKLTDLANLQIQNTKESFTRQLDSIEIQQASFRGYITLYPSVADQVKHVGRLITGEDFSKHYKSASKTAAKTMIINDDFGIDLP